MAINSLITRRQVLAGMGTITLSPCSSLFAQPINKMRGAFMIMSTPYTEDNQVDYEDLANEVAFCAKCEVQGLVWPQNSSEQRYLSKEERIKGFQTLAEANRGTGMALVLGVQADDTEGMLEYAEVAESLNPDGMIAIPPITATTLNDVRNYYRALCEVTEKPIFVQTSGGPDIELTVDFLVDLARELPQCGYVKEEYGRVQERMLALQKYQPDPIRSVFGATFGRGWLYEMRIGTDGVMTGGAMYADVFAKMWELHLIGDEEALLDCYSRLLLISNLDSLIPGVRLYVMQKRGVFKTTKSRRGEYSFTPQQIEEIEYRFAALKPYLVV